MGVVIALGLAAFFRSKWGVRMRAIAEDGSTARMLGINAGSVADRVGVRNRWSPGQP